MKLVSVQKAAERLNMDRRAVEDLLRARKLSYRRVEGEIRITEYDLVAYERKMRRERER
jgi:excisionase family DNA binding protein